ncbi:MAG TPA: SDR family oxidoreductase [bacterium]|nr:SDR family oxidoreductase [bacterium]
MSLNGKVAVITGGSTGVGRAVGEIFAGEGVRVVLAARTESQLEAAAEALREAGGDVLAVPTDVSSRKDCERLMATAVEHFGPVDILVNNAGVGIYNPVDKMTDQELDPLLAINLKGTIYCSQAVYLRMKERGSGHIINVASIAGKMGLPRESGYNASKFGMVGFGQSLKKEAIRYGVRVHNICPGGINTPFWDGVQDKPDLSQFLDPEHVAGLVHYVAASPERMVFQDIIVHPHNEYLEWFA